MRHVESGVKYIPTDQVLVIVHFAVLTRAFYYNPRHRTAGMLSSVRSTRESERAREHVAYCKRNLGPRSATSVPYERTVCLSTIEDVYGQLQRNYADRVQNSKPLQLPATRAII